MLYAIHALDRADAGPLRLATRSAHLEYAAGFDTIYGGPLLDEAGEMCGSLIVLEAENRTAAEDFVEGDPYTRAGLFASVDVRGFRQVLGLGD